MTSARRNVYKKLAVALAAISLAAILLFMSPGTEAGIGTPYIDENGTPRVADTIDLTPGPQTLIAGEWYSVSSNMTCTITLTGPGEINLIIANGAVLTTDALTTIDSTTHFKIYTNSNVPAQKGVFTRDGDVIEIDGGILTNTAILRTGLNGKPILIGAAGGTVINNGVIRTGVGTWIGEGSTSHGIDAVGPALITNLANGLIQGTMLRFEAGGTIDNYGILISHGMGYPLTTLECSNPASTLTINNYATGSILTNRPSSYAIGGGTLLSGGPFAGTGANIILNNMGLIQGSAGGIGNGVALTSLILNNSGTISGPAAIDSPNSTDLENSGTIVGTVTLGSGTPAGTFNVTLAAGGIVTGNVALGNAADNHIINLTLEAKPIGNAIDGSLTIGSASTGTLSFTGTPAGSPMLYVKVTGTVDIGPNTTVDIDGSGLHATMQPGDEIILLESEAGAISGVPVNASVTSKGYVLDLSFNSTSPPAIGSQLIATLNNIYASDYVLVKGNVANSNVVILDAAYLIGSSYVLDDTGPSSGWFLVNADLPVGLAIETNGNVNIIIAGGCTMSVPGIDVLSGNLGIYTHPVGTTGKLELSSVFSIELPAGSELINTAVIEAAALGGMPVILNGNSTVTNGVTGEINGEYYGIWLKAGGTVNNYGLIDGANSTGIIASNVAITVNNYAGDDAGIGADEVYVGTIKGGINGIWFNVSGGSIDNYGSIEGNTGVFFNGTLINRIGAVIDGSANGVMLQGGGSITNSGVINATAAGGYGVINSGGPATLINYDLITGIVSLSNTVNNVTFGKGSKIDGSFSIGTNTASTLYFTGTFAAGDPLVYSVVTGNANIGPASATVTFDETGLPGTYAGEAIVLIDAVTMTGAPSNKFYVTGGGVRFQIFVKNNDLIAMPLQNATYTWTDGSTLTQSNVVELTQSFFPAAPYALDAAGPSAGWFLVTENITLTGTLSITGNVSIIVADGCILSIGNISVSTGLNFATYAQPVNNTGRVNGTTNSAQTVLIAANCTYTNTATISSLGTTSPGVTASGTATIINGVTGVIIGSNGVPSGPANGVQLNATGKIDNAGRIVGAPGGNTAGISAGASITLINRAGATITGSAGVYIANFSGAVLGVGDTFDNYGLIEGTSVGGSDTTGNYQGRGVYVVRGSNLLLTNYSTGKIEGQLRGIQFASTTPTGKIDNSGRIYGGTTNLPASPSYGIHSLTSVTIVNNAGGTIIASTGVYIGNFAGATDSFTNNGTIQGTASHASSSSNTLGHGVYVNGGSNILLTNNSTGVITAIYSGINLPAGVTTAKIDNFGSIHGNSVGITAVRSVSITNTGDGITNGKITSGMTAISVGNLAGAGGDAITNSGLIEGAGSRAILISAGSNILITNNAAGKIIANTSGANAIYLGTLTVPSGKIDNYGRIAGNATNGTALYVSGSVSVANASGDGVNTGIITGATGIRYGIFNGSVDSVTNNGVIKGTAGYGIYFVSGTGIAVNNNATGIIMGTTSGIQLDAATVTGTINNRGGISGDTAGINAAASATVNNFADGAITGGTNAVRIANFNGAVDSFTNGGLIESTVQDAIHFANGTGILVTNNSTGVITGYTNGIWLPATALTGTVDNSGGIFGRNSGVYANASATIKNSADAVIAGTSYGVRIANFNGTVDTIVNSGLIEGTGAAGIGLAIFNGTGVLITNNVTGMIAGTVYGIEFATAVATGTINNHGGISAGNAATSYGIWAGTSATIINFADAAIACGNGVYIGNFHGFNGVSGDVFTNSGLIKAMNGCGVIIAHGTHVLITNNTTGIIAGTVYGVEFATTVATGIIDNYGDISGGTTVTSYGIWAGTSATIMNFADASITGGNGVYIGNFHGFDGTSGDVFTNNGLIDATNGSGVYFVHGTHLLITNNITGVITASVDGILFATTVATGKIDNYGSISGNSIGIFAHSSATVENAAGAVIDGNYGIYITSMAASDTVTNSGLIQGSSYGIYIANGTHVLITNDSTGVITAVTRGIFVRGSTSVIENDGSIAATNDCGIYGATPLTVNNNAGGYIKGGTDGIWLIEGGTVDNNGYIEGGTNGILSDIYLTIINYAGCTITGGNGISVHAFSSAAHGITNYGLIQGTTLAGIHIVSGSHALITNESSGVITGATEGIRLSHGGTIDNFGGISGALFGITLDNGGSIYNYNVISDGIYEDNGGSIYNYDLITGGIYADGGQTYLEQWSLIIGDVILADETNHVVLAVDSVINGNFTIGSDRVSRFEFVGAPDPIILKFATVTGSADIGSAMVLSPVAAPPGFTGNTTILIDALGGITGAPSNTIVIMGGLFMDLKIRTGNQLILVLSGIPPVHDYYIKASSDLNSSISPMGVVTVPGGGSQTFRFWANEGFAILVVYVDGVALTQSEIDAGSYTFRDVKANHTIEVFSTAAIILEITIHGGNGIAKYNVNGRGYVEYTQVVVLPGRAFLSLMAIADEEYEFKEWRKGTDVFTSSDISFDDVRSNLKLDLYFEDGGGTDSKVNLLWWILLLLALLILAAFLFWFLVYYRRAYDVIKVSHHVHIIGKDRVRRKSAYTFTIHGTHPGTVSYKIGEEGHWKVIHPNEKGEHTIPKGEITDHVTIEHR